MSGTGAACVLLSGGVDSALVATLLLQGGRPTSALFVDYGQPAARAELTASRAVAGHLGVAWRQVAVAGLAVPASGETPGRNDLLLAVAAAAAPGCDLAVGVHAGTGYADCSPAHRDAWQALLDRQHGGTLRVLAPLIDLGKAEVLGLAADSAVPFSLTHSCEAGNDPCGRCLSCLDREVLLDGP